MITKTIKTALQFLADSEKAAFYPKFFKTGKGDYGEGDIFIGVSVPEQRKVAKQFWNNISLEELTELLSSDIHEHRLTALLMLVMKFEKTKDPAEKNILVEFYLSHKKYVNNWDLVDTSCYKILGRYCFENQDSSPIIHLSDEDNLWSKRIAIVSTMYFIKNGEFDLTKTLALKNMHHQHDLIQKANGWLLREMGNKNEQELIDFLKAHYKTMPRTSLRYSIEKLDESLRQDFLKGQM